MSLKIFFKIIALSFYSPTFYRAVALSWKHWGLGFLIRFSILVSLFVSISVFVFISSIDFQNDSMQNFMSLIPQIKVVDGKAQYIDANLKSPLYIGQKNFLVLDLDSNASDKYSDFSIIFAADYIKVNFLDSSNFIINYNSLLKNDNQKIITPETLASVLIDYQKIILVWIMIIGVPVGSVIYFILTLLRVGFYSLVANFFIESFGVNLKFKSLMRVAIIANVPSFLLSNVLIVLLGTSLAISNQWIITIIYLLYFLGAILICSKKTKFL